jgi:integrase
MSNLKLPKNPYKGIKLFCRTCRVDNPKCSHHDRIIYRVRVHVPGTTKDIKSKMLSATNYEDAVAETIEFEKELKSNGYETIIPKVDEGNDFSVLGAIVKYNQYLNGISQYSHLRKDVSKGHIDEMIRFCRFFAKILKHNYNIERMRIVDVSQQDVADFYVWAEEHYSPKTFNKCLAGLKGFFDFLIEVEEVEMKNPFRKYVRKFVPQSDIMTINKDEFELIIQAVDNYSPYCVLGGKGERKNLYRPYLKDGFKLFLLSGGRREEVVDLKWSSIFESDNKIKFFRIENLKVSRIMKKETVYKYIPITDDLFDFLKELGYEEKRNTDEYILFPQRYEKTKTMMDVLSKSFTHYRIGSGIEKEISLSDLRKTYISWVNNQLGDNTGLVTSHSTNQVLEKFYLDPKILTAIETTALKVRVFGNTNS